MVGIEEIRRAARRIEGRVVRTPLLECESLGLAVKAENLQHAGSFKVRGVFNALLSYDELPKGIATFSAGNHAAAVAYATRSVGIPAVVCMPPHAVPTKIDNVRRYGGEVVLTDDLFGTCQSLARERGFTVLHPFDDPAVIAGQGTVGLEIGPADVVIVPVGGGGLISGIAAAMPGTRIVGVEPESANAMSRALRAGSPVTIKPTSFADGLAAPFAGEHTLAHVQALVDEVVEVSEESIRAAWWPLMDATKLLLEPSAVVGLAALNEGLVRRGDRTVLVLSGGNAPSLLDV